MNSFNNLLGINSLLTRYFIPMMNSGANNSKGKERCQKGWKNQWGWWKSSKTNEKFKMKINFNFNLNYIVSYS